MEHLHTHARARRQQHETWAAKALAVLVHVTFSFRSQDFPFCCSSQVLHILRDNRTQWYSEPLRLVHRRHARQSTPRKREPKTNNGEVPETFANIKHVPQFSVGALWCRHIRFLMHAKNFSPFIITSDERRAAAESGCGQNGERRGGRASECRADGERAIHNFREIVRCSVRDLAEGARPTARMEAAQTGGGERTVEEK